MKHENDLPEGATPIDPDEAAGLKPNLTTRGELNAFEQANIAQALTWAIRSRKLRSDLLSYESLKLLHKKMFEDTWKWAGTFRITGKNIGVEPHQIQMQLVSLCDDAKYWINNEVLPLDECAVRIHLAWCLSIHFLMVMDVTLDLQQICCFYMPKRSP